MEMRTSKNGLAVIMAFEGCHEELKSRPGYFKAYVDPVGVLTIGWGHTNHHPPSFTKDAIWSQEKCDQVLEMDLQTFEAHVSKNAKVPLLQHEFDALVSWAYNTGGPKSATLWKELNKGNKKAIPGKLAVWNKAKGKVLAGLTRRRKAEGLLFQGKIAEAFLVAGVKVPKEETITPIRKKLEFDPQVQAVQESLRDLGYVSVGEPDGKLGSMTIGAIAAFRSDWHLPVDAVIDEELKKALKDALNKGWKRPIMPERREATPSELAPSIPEIKSAKEAEKIGFWAAIGGFTTTVTSALVSSLGDAIEWLTPLKTFVGDVPWYFWIAAALVGSGMVWYVSKKAGDAKKEATKAYQQGART